MSKFTRLKVAGVFALTIALALSFVGCGGNSGSGIGDTSSGVAATVDGDPIGEKTITEYIQNFRESSDLMDDEAWGKWMANNNYTPETVREEVINFYVEQLLYERAAKEFNVEVTDEDVQEALDETKSMFDSDEAWNDALEASGYTEETYVNDVIRPDLLEEKLAAAVSSSNDSGAEDSVLTTLQENASSIDGAKRSSHILFSIEDRDTAEQVLEQLKNGEIEWDAAVEQYSTDTGSKSQGGDVGWDVLTQFVDEYQNALDTLENGEMSDLIESQFGYHIIRITDVYNVPEGGITTTDDVPEEIFAYVVDNETSATDTNAFYTWYAEYQANATVIINPMPEGLPYAVDMSKYGVTEEPPSTVEEDVNETIDVASEPTAESTDDQSASVDQDQLDQGADEAAAADRAADNAENQNSN